MNAQLPVIELTGVMKSGQNSSAYINGSLYRTGEMLPSGFRVDEILSDGITVIDTADGQRYYVPVGKPDAVKKLETEANPEQVKPKPETPPETLTILPVSEYEEEEASKIPFNPAAVLSVILLVIGLIVSFIGGLWLIVVCFQESIWWGLGALLLPLVQLIFLILHWNNAKKPFAISLAGTALTYLAIFLMPDM